MSDKDVLRSFFLSMRKSPSREVSEERSQRICEYLQEEISEHNRLIGYWPVHGEVDIRPLMGVWLAMGRRLFLPRVRGKHLEMVQVFDLEKGMKTGIYGIPEPIGKEAFETPDVVLVPGVVFDRRGYRIGYGGGFYDRFLAPMSVIPKIGVAYRFQIIKEVPHSKHDVPVSSLVCERGWIK